MTSMYSVAAMFPLVEPPPGAMKGLAEIALLLLGAGKWPALVVAVGAALVAYNYREGTAEANSSVQGVAIAVASGAATWFVMGLIFE